MTVIKQKLYTGYDCLFNNQKPYPVKNLYFTTVPLKLYAYF